MRPFYNPSSGWWITDASKAGYHLLRKPANDTIAQGELSSHAFVFVVGAAVVVALLLFCCCCFCCCRPGYNLQRTFCTVVSHESFSCVGGLSPSLPVLLLHTTPGSASPPDSLSSTSCSLLGRVFLLVPARERLSDRLFIAVPYLQAPHHRRHAIVCVERVFVVSSTFPSAT